MIKLFETFNEYNQVKDWLDRKNIKNYIINDDLTVDVNDNVSLSEYKLEELPIQFGRVNGGFYISSNKLNNLKGCPSYVSGDFYCSYNELTSLEGGPMYVDGIYRCSNNKLTTLNFSPDYIGDILFCQNNKLTTLKVLPKYIEVGFNCAANPLPDEVVFFCNLNVRSKILLENQGEYGIWNSDGSFNPGRWDMFIKDFKAGILN